MHNSGVLVLGLFLSVLGGLSSMSLFMYWCMLELNLLWFLGVLWCNKKMGSSLGVMKYFLVQGLSSMLLVLGVFLMSDGLICLSLVIKMGLFPFHYWGLDLACSSNWFIFILLMTVQKILPLQLMSGLSMNFKEWGIFMLMGGVVSCLGSFYKSNLKGLMFYSSLFNFSLIMMLGGSLTNLNLFLMYSIILFPCWAEFSEFNPVNIQDLQASAGVMWAFMSLGGFPPMLGFIFKWSIFKYLLLMDYSKIFLLLLIIMNLFMLYVYLNIIFMIIMNMNLNILSLKSGKSMVVMGFHGGALLLGLVLMYSLKSLFWK